MRAKLTIGGIGATTLVVLGSLGGATSAHASNFGPELNGTYRVVSNGDWATTNDVRIRQQTVVETWTISTTCVSPIECSGEVRSDLGWTGTARLADYWYIEHIVPNWMPCPNGTFADGKQVFRIWAMNPDIHERVDSHSRVYGGRNTTKSPSGACGVNKPKVIDMPVRMEQLS